MGGQRSKGGQGGTKSASGEGRTGAAGSGGSGRGAPPEGESRRGAALAEGARAQACDFFPDEEPESGFRSNRPPGAARPQRPLDPLTGVAWVDDVVLTRPVPPHAACTGLEGGCPVCHGELEKFQQGVAYWYWLNDELGLQLAIEKRQPPGQSVNFVGLRADTLRRRVSMIPAKLDKTCAGIEALMKQSDASGRELDRVRCRSLHYSVAIMGTRVPAASIALALGTEEKPDYDARFVITDDLRNHLRELLSLTKRNASKGAYLWPPSAASVYAKLARGELQDNGDSTLPIFSLTFRADERGWAALLSVRDKRLGHILLWGPASEVAGGSPEERNARAARQAMSRALRREELEGYVAVLRGFDGTTMTALEKGSTTSPALQQEAMLLNRMLVAKDLVPKFMTVAGPRAAGALPGQALRDNIAAEPGPHCTPVLRRMIANQADSLHWGEITVDLFATGAHHQSERGWSRFEEVGCEGVNAFGKHDWNLEHCGTCGKLHRELALVMPPLGLVGPAIKRCREDGARVMLVVPRSITAPWWPALIRACRA